MNRVVFILLTVLVDAIGFGIILPILPKLIMKLSGEGISQASIYGGWLWFAYAVMQFFCAPVLGNLSDRYGRRPVILFSLLTFGIDYLIMGFAPTLFWLFVGRSIAGMAGASFVPAYSYLADVSPPERRAQNFGLIGAAFGSGFVLGPAIGGLLGAMGTRAPFFAAAGLALINFLFGLFVLPESLSKESRRPFDPRRANPLGTLLQMRKYPSVTGLLLVQFLWQLAHQVFPSTWAYYTMFKFGWSERAVGISLAFVGMIMAFSTAGMTRVLVPRLGEQRAARFGLLTGTAAFVGYALASRGWMMYAFLVAWLLAGLVQPSVMGLMSRQIPANAQGELQGGVASLYSLSAVVGPPLMTQVFGYFSSERARVHFPGAAFLCAAALAFAGLLLLARAPRAARAYSPAAAAVPE